jgi:hypothetical protein
MPADHVMDGALNSQYRRLPQVGEFISRDQMQQLLHIYPEDLVIETSRRVIARLRSGVKQGAMTDAELQTAIEQLSESVAAELAKDRAQSLRSVINATGVILQTNLGRAPLSQAAIRRIEEVASGYCNLEFDLPSGERGQRGISVEKLILRLLAAKASAAASRSALVVNNCAAATYLALNSLAEGGEVIVSRGELVEIGGGFRIPDILRKSGALLREALRIARGSVTTQPPSHPRPGSCCGCIVPTSASRGSRSAHRRRNSSIWGNKLPCRFLRIKARGAPRISTSTESMTRRTGQTVYRAVLIWWRPAATSYSAAHNAASLWAKAQSSRPSAAIRCIAHFASISLRTPHWREHSAPISAAIGRASR